MSKNKLSEKEIATFLAELKNLINNSLEDGKAQDITILDVSKLTDFCHYMVVATGTSSRHLSALAERIVYDLKHSGLEVNYRTEGVNEGSNWVLIDCMDIIVHLFMPDSRGEYKIEELWSGKK